MNKAIDEIKKLRAERKSERQRMINISSELSDILNELDESNRPVVLNWTLLQEMKKGVIYEINDKVCFVPVSITDDVCQFVTIIKRGGKFGTHVHDITEYCKILKGQLVEPLEDYKIINVGETQEYKKGLVHSPISGDADITICWVEFKK